MPTDKPRVQVTLTRGSYEVLSRLARARGVSRSQVLAELFEAAQPAMMKVAELVEMAKAAPKEVLQRFAGAVEGGERDAERAFAQGVGQLDLLLHGLKNGKPWDSDDEPPVPGASGATAGTAALRPAPRTPVPVTRGSGVKLAGRRNTHQPRTEQGRGNRKPAKKQRSRR